MNSVSTDSNSTNSNPDLIVRSPPTPRRRAFTPLALTALRQEPESQCLTPRSQALQKATHLFIPGAGVIRHSYRMQRRPSFSLTNPIRATESFEETKYYISAELGQGGNSVVYEANLVPHKKCALIVDTTPAGICTPSNKEETLDTAIKANLAASVHLWERLARDLPHITPELYLQGGVMMPKMEDTARNALAIELLERLDFRAISNQMKVLYCNELLEHVEKLREKRILHRDIKPDNLMTRNDGSLVMIDWNEALFLDELEKMDEACFNACIDRLCSSEAYDPSGYGEAFAKLKSSKDDYTLRREALIGLETVKEEYNIRMTLLEILEGVPEALFTDAIKSFLASPTHRPSSPQEA